MDHLPPEIQAHLKRQFDAYVEYLPEHMVGGMKRYLFDRIEPGSFLMAVLVNDLKEAVGRADHINKQRLGDIVMFCANGLPNIAWGSKEKVEKWLHPTDSDEVDH